MGCAAPLHDSCLTQRLNWMLKIYKIVSLFYHTTVMDVEHKHQQFVSHTPKIFPSDSPHAMKSWQKWEKYPSRMTTV